MKINTNTWNKIRYTFYTPVYDLVGRYFSKSRKESIDSLDIKSGDEVLIVGGGTGLDLEFFPENCEVTLTDITPAMLVKAKKRIRKLAMNIVVQVMDGQQLKFENNSFDKVVLHLILAVIPDPVACLKESERVLRAGGKIAVFDKFVGKNKKAGLIRKFFNVFSNFLASDITRSFERIHAETKLEILSDVPADLNGNFRRILLKKN